PTVSAQLAWFYSQYDLPPKGQEDGWHEYLYKDLRTILGKHVRGKFHVRYCGGGRLRRCRDLMWAALESAGSTLAAAQGPDPSAWRSDATRERIRFIPGLLPFTMRYTNRPSGIQQVLSFSGPARRHRRR